MKRLETFLGSIYYIIFILGITFLSWSQFESTPPHEFNYYNMVGIITVITLGSLVLIFFKNTLYAIPNFIGLLFIISKSDMSFDTVGAFGFIYIAFTILVLGPVIHLIRFKPKFKKGYFFLGILLIALSYVISLIYLPFDIRAIPTSFIAFLYLLIYVFFNSTLKLHKSYLMKLFIVINLLMTAQVLFYIYQGYLLYPDLELYYRILKGWNRNLGWANINDMCFYIAFTYPAYAYYIKKYPKNILFWFLMFVPVVAVMLSGSRGGIIGFGFIFIAVLIYLNIKVNKYIRINGFIALALFALFAYVFREVIFMIYDDFIDRWNEGLDAFSSNRISIYKYGLEVFKKYPVFGGGWLSAEAHFGNRIFMYHSTIIQSLAAMGLFGFISLIIHYKQILWFTFKHLTTTKILFILGYGASQLHGLIDNVQYAVPYSVLLVLALAILEHEQKLIINHDLID